MSGIFGEKKSFTLLLKEASDKEIKAINKEFNLNLKIKLDYNFLHSSIKVESSKKKMNQNLRKFSAFYFEPLRMALQIALGEPQNVTPIQEQFERVEILPSGEIKAGISFEQGALQMHGIFSNTTQVSEASIEQMAGLILAKIKKGLIFVS